MKVREKDDENPYGKHNAFERIDSGHTEAGADSISELHRVSFIRDIIPAFVARKKGGEKVRILDAGTGAAFFPDQIRKEFPDQVRVFSTGLSKRSAVEYRKNKKPPGEERLHQDDLKWRSVSELSDFEEFDLIVDTYGEMLYLNLSGNPDDSLDSKEIVDYLTMVIKKLKPGGLASIAPIRLKAVDHRGILNIRAVFQELENNYGVKFILPTETINVLRIEKSER